MELLRLDGFFAASYRENMAVERRLAVGVLDKINGFIKKRVLTESAFRGPVPLAADDDGVELSMLEHAHNLVEHLWDVRARIETHAGEILLEVGDERHFLLQHSG